jgi:hypothetical protein
VGELEPASIAPDARAGITRPTQWVELHRLGYHGQSSLHQQLYPGGLSAIPAAISMGLAQHAVLAQVYRMKQRMTQFTHASQAIANVELLGIDLTVAPRSAHDGADRCQKGLD